MKWLRDINRGYTDREIERVYGWIVRRENLSGDTIYLNAREMRVFHDFAVQWDVTDANVRCIR